MATIGLQKQEDDVHILFLPCLIDGETYAIDLGFSVVVEMRRCFAASATP